MGNLTDFVKRELKSDNLLNTKIGNSVAKLMEVFSSQGHSGMSASVVRNMFVNNIKDNPDKINKDLFSEDGDFYGGGTGKALKELSTTFKAMNLTDDEKEIVLKKFNLLADWKPLTPLTFKDEEWGDISECESYQNIRNSAVFKKGKGGKPYYIDAYVMMKENGTGWSGSLTLKGNKRVRLCYIKDAANMPTIKINVPTIQHSDDPADWDFLPLDESALDELKKYYDLEIVEETV